MDRRAAPDDGVEEPALPFFVVSTYYGGTLASGDDQTCIQNTLNAANEAGGGIVILPPRQDSYVYKYSQLVIPRWVCFRGAGWYTFGANGSIARLQQLTGVNDDSIIFNDSGDANTYPFIGPFGITDLVFRGASGSTAGHAINFRVPDGRMAGVQDLTTIERLQIRGFAGSGIYVPKASPMSISDVAGLANGRYAVEIEEQNNPSVAGVWQVHQVLLKNLSGDCNMGGVADGGGATLFLKGLRAGGALISAQGVKSEYRIRGTADGGDGTAMGNFNAVIIEDCTCPIGLTGVEHISSASQTRKPGNAIQVKGSGRPDLMWQAVGVRDTVAAQTVGSAPYRVFDEVLARGSSAPHGALGPSIESYKADQVATQIDTERRDELTSGESTLPRRGITSTGATLTAGALRLTYFIARKTETITQVRTCSGSAAAVGATLCRIGVYEVDDSGNLTLVASTANDTSLWSRTNTTYAKSFTSGFTKKRGVRYAVGGLVVGASTPPGLVGQTQLHQEEAAQSPRLCGSVSRQTDLPSNISAGSISDSTVQVYAALAP